MVAIPARAVAHLFDTRGLPAIETGPPPEAARTLLIGFRQVKKPSSLLTL
jgi:hypothetical protein